MGAFLLTLLPEKLRIFFDYLAAFRVGGGDPVPDPAAQGPVPATPAPLRRHDAATTSLLSLRGLGIRFGGLVAVDQVDFDLPASHITCIIGPNGAGKSTLFNLISGIYKPSAGNALGLRPSPDCPPMSSRRGHRADLPVLAPVRGPVDPSTM